MSTRNTEKHPKYFLSHSGYLYIKINVCMRVATQVEHCLQADIGQGQSKALAGHCALSL